MPPGGYQVRRGTQVVVKVTVGTDGHATNCSVYRASPDAEADAITCRLVTQRLRFKPATDAAGNPVPAPFYWQQRWF
jgi:protein TonB